MKILLAEDSKVYRALIEDLLKDWGFDLVVAENGEQAWEILRQPDGPRLALLDWMLPGIDGLELCQRIRAMPTSGRYIYTLLLTARDKKADLIAALEAGADDYQAAVEKQTSLIVAVGIAEQKRGALSCTRNWSVRGNRCFSQPLGIP